MSGATRPRPLCLRENPHEQPAIVRRWPFCPLFQSAKASTLTIAGSSFGESGVCRLRPQHCLCGVGGYSPPSALLELHLQPLPQPRGKHAWLFSTAPHIMPRGWGASANGGPLNPAPGCPSHPFSLAAANSATARGNISTTACAPLVRHPAHLRFACALFIPHSFR